MVEPINPQKREKMIELRKEMGLKTREIAPLLGVSFQHYNDIERGTRNPSIELSYQLAKFFDLPIHYFLKDRTKFTRGES